MTHLAKYLSSYLHEHLPRERRASQHTIEAYAYAFQLFVCFAAKRFKVQPSELQIEQLDAQIVLQFLRHLELDRQCGPKTRNARLAAIKSFFRFLEYRLVSCINQSRSIHAIPMKKADDRLIDFLTRDEVQALIDAPDIRTVAGLRDRAMLHLSYAAGLRVSELIGMTLSDIQFQPSAIVTVMGKGRRERALPLWTETVIAVRAWMAVRANTRDSSLFVNAKGGHMSRSGFEYILAKHSRTASAAAQTISGKRISPHVLRHSCAMHILVATRDIRKVSLWLGHATIQSTEAYLRADSTEQLETLCAMASPSIRPGRFRSPDKLMALLQPTANRRHYAQH